MRYRTGYVVLPFLRWLLDQRTYKSWNLSQSQFGSLCIDQQYYIYGISQSGKKCRDVRQGFEVFCVFICVCVCGGAFGSGWPSGLDCRHSFKLACEQRSVGWRKLMEKCDFEHVDECEHAGFGSFTLPVCIHKLELAKCLTADCCV